MEPEKTKLASHFLTVSIESRHSTQKADEPNAAHGDHIIVFAMEVLVYSTKDLITMFVSKADSTGYLPHQRPSPIKVIATTFLWWLGTQQRRKQPQDLLRIQLSKKKLVISLFARAQSQYLFPGSADNGKKHVLDDRQLIKWWARVLDPLFPKRDEMRSSMAARESTYQGYMTVPGYNSQNELKSFLPPSNYSAGVGQHWQHGNPLRELAKARGISEAAPTRCLLPRFPDDPKARFMQDLDDEVGLMEDAGSLATTSPSKRKNGRWKTIHDLDLFWEGMEFRQECSSGRVVGFLWLVVQTTPEALESEHQAQIWLHYGKDPGGRFPRSPELDPANIDLAEAQTSQESQTSQQSARSTSSIADGKDNKRRNRLTGPVIARQPRLKGGSSNLSATSDPGSTNNIHTLDGPFLTKEGYDSAMSTLLHLDFSTPAAAGHSTSKWVNEVSSMSGMKAEDWALDVVGTAELEDLVRDTNSSGALPTNDLGNLVRKKRKAPAA